MLEQTKKETTYANTNTVDVKRNKMKIYALGGCGINNVIPLTLHENMANPGYADYDAVLVDTSRSNLIPGVPENRFYHIQNASDGSGKNKAENYSIIKQEIPRMLATEGFEPADINVVVFATAGGTGSTAAHVLIDELLSRKTDTIVVGVAVVSSESGKAASNSYKTLIGLNNVATANGKPVVIHVVDEANRDKADEKLKAFISNFALLTSNEHLELDTKDIANLLNYSNNNITFASPSLAEIQCYVDPQKPEAIKDAISVAELHEHTSVELGKVKAMYSCNGYLRHPTGDNITSRYFVVTSGNLNTLVDNLKKQEEDLRNASMAQREVSFNDNFTKQDDGMIL